MFNEPIDTKKINEMTYKPSSFRNDNFGENRSIPAKNTDEKTTLDQKAKPSVEFSSVFIDVLFGKYFIIPTFTPSKANPLMRLEIDSKVVATPMLSGEKYFVTIIQKKNPNTAMRSVLAMTYTEFLYNISLLNFLNIRVPSRP
jgi:hypothetical protein